MKQKKISMQARKRIALIAHDSMKDDLLEWALQNRTALAESTLYATGTTGRLLSKELDIEIHNMKSGPLGGDLQIGTKIAEGKIDVLIFFWDPLEAQPHDPDVKALLRMAVVWNIPAATNRATADFIFSSPYMVQPYQRIIQDYSKHLKRMDGKI